MIAARKYNTEKSQSEGEGQIQNDLSYNPMITQSEN